MSIINDLHTKKLQLKEEILASIFQFYKEASVGEERLGLVHPVPWKEDCNIVSIDWNYDKIYHGDNWTFYYVQENETEEVETDDTPNIETLLDIFTSLLEWGFYPGTLNAAPPPESLS